MKRVSRLLADTLDDTVQRFTLNSSRKNCIINNKALIEHDSLIGDHSHIATGPIVNGEVAVRNESFIGSGTVTNKSVSIGNDCIIGAGVVVKIDI